MSQYFHKTILVILLTAPMAVSAYGNRNWLSANQDFSKNISDNTYTWGYNYRMNGRHTTVQLRDDEIGWMYGGNLRNNSSNGIFRWKKFKSAR